MSDYMRRPKLYTQDDIEELAGHAAISGFVVGFFLCLIPVLIAGVLL